MANDNGQRRHPQLIAAVAGAIALWCFFGVQSVTPGIAEAAGVIRDTSGASNRSADYFPAQFTPQFTLQPAADESDEPISTF